MQDPLPPRRALEPFPLVKREADVLVLALAVAARSGDPDPELVQHTIGSRESATKTTGSWVASEEPSYLIAIRGRFEAPRAPGPPRLRRPGWEQDTVSFSVQVLVVELKSGRITDSGGDRQLPDLASVGPVITDYRASAVVARQHWRRVHLWLHRRRVIAHAKAIQARSAPVELRYVGTVTVGSPGRARLHARAGGLTNFIWQALSDSGWLGHPTVDLQPTIELSMCLPPAPQPAQHGPVRVEFLAGGTRRVWEPGAVGEDGSVHQRYGGPLHSRAARSGFRLVESEGRPEDFDVFEDLLYTAAVHAGWLTDAQGPMTAADIPGVEIIIRLPATTSESSSRTHVSHARISEPRLATMMEQGSQQQSAASATRPSPAVQRDRSRPQARSIPARVVKSAGVVTHAELGVRFSACMHCGPVPLPRARPRPTIHGSAPVTLARSVQFLNSRPCGALQALRASRCQLRRSGYTFASPPMRPFGLPTSPFKR